MTIDWNLAATIAVGGCGALLLALAVKYAVGVVAKAVGARA